MPGFYTASDNSDTYSVGSMPNGVDPVEPIAIVGIGKLCADKLRFVLIIQDADYQEMSPLLQNFGSF
jgi:hypothetical protein